jgi:tetratricopeptide (TPR) repeat protein
VKPQKVIPWVLIASGLLVYHNSFHNGFVFDDERHIVQNVRIRHFWPPWEIIDHTSRPVVMVSVALNYAGGGLNPRGYHLFNVAVHILAALTLYQVLRLTLLSERLRSRFGETASSVAGVIAMIWLVHPLQTESVTYTIQRGELLMGLFYLLTLYCVIRSCGSWRGAGPAGSGAGWGMCAVASCALGMASKPVMVTAPVVVLLYDRVFLAKSWREVIKRRRALYAGLAATWLLLPVLLAKGATEWTASAGFSYSGISPLQYALTQPGVILHYLRLTFWPHPLCLDYGWKYGWPPVRSLGDAGPQLLAIGLLLAATAYAWRRQPALGFVGIWFFAILAPTSSLIPVADLAVEHRMYLPLAAVIALTVAGGLALGSRLPSGRRQVARTIGWGTSAALVLVLAILTAQRNRDYRSALTIWKDTVAKRPNNPRAHCGLGVALWHAGRVREATEQWEEALRIKPDYAEAHCSLGVMLGSSGRIEEAIEHLEQAVRLRPDLVEAHYNLGGALEQAGHLETAIAQYEETLRLDSDYAPARDRLAHLRRVR